MRMRVNWGIFSRRSQWTLSLWQYVIYHCKYGALMGCGTRRPSRPVGPLGSYRRLYWEEQLLIDGSDANEVEKDAKKMKVPATHKRSGTQGSGYITDSSSSRGDILSSEDEMDDAVHLEQRTRNPTHVSLQLNGGTHPTSSIATPSTFRLPFQGKIASIGDAHQRPERALLATTPRSLGIHMNESL
jgi:hypothetical protein